jgi:hypothetical protein
MQFACAQEEGCAIQARLISDDSQKEVAMARGREKDKKTRKKHRKNIKRMKAIAKVRRAAAPKSKRK